MKFRKAIDLYIADMRSCSRINSDTTETAYRNCLEAHAIDVDNRDPRLTGREDVKSTLTRWPHPNTQRNRRSVLISFYDWMVEEGMRPHNPARQTRRPKKRDADVYRMTVEEVVAFINATRGEREERAVYLGCCAGLRNAEIRGLQGRHFTRDGYVWVSRDIAKGGRERFVPVIPDLERIVAGIRADIAVDEYILPAQRWRNPPRNTVREDLAKVQSSPQGLYYLVKRVAERARISGNIHPHSMRHAFADHIARHAGVQVAQLLLGHADLGTTQTYLGKPTLDALTDAVQGASYGLSPIQTPEKPVKATTGIEPVTSPSRAVEPEEASRVPHSRS